MRIDFLQISNVLSFKFVSDISQAEKIAFDDGLNIIIGENGAGKSTLLEIINFLFRRVIYRQFNLNQDLFDRRRQVSVDDRRQVLIPTNQQAFTGFRLEPNWDSEAEEQRIRISLQLDEIDKENIRNIGEHFDTIMQSANQFSHHAPSLTNHEHEVCVVDVVLNQQSGTFSVQFPTTAPDFGFTYLSDYHFFKEAISLHNFLNPTKAIRPLFESFTLISSYRNYHAFQPSISLGSAPAAQQIQQIRSQDYSRSLNASDSNEPPIFGLVRLQVAERHFDLVDEAKSPEEREAEANNLPFMTSINARLRIVNLRCQIQLIDKRTWQYTFQFYDTRRNRPIGDINCLSAGQKAIIHLVLEAYGRGELKGGVVIIDEPEIHLHYQFQHEYLQVIRDLNQDQNCQYILVTHSEALINSTTINSVRRFALSANGSTEVHSPTLTADQKSLIQILDNTRSTYAFFAKKVLLVEGETDRYFFRGVLQQQYRHLDQEIAVLHIGGKGAFVKWRDLFSEFGLTVSAIADFDYLVNLHYPAERAVALKTPQAITEFKLRNPDWEVRINAQYENRTFVLKEGDLEEYLNIGKDLEEVITFCGDNLVAFLADDASTRSKEVRSILERIVA
jgi:predicted ATP-dependent endonuclease of OLD family